MPCPFVNEKSKAVGNTFVKLPTLINGAASVMLPLEGAERKLAYKGEREVVKLAQKYLESNLQEVH